MKTVKQFILYAYLILATTVCAIPLKAQGPPVYKPGETIRISIKFDGADATKITSASFYAKTATPTNANQPNFQTDFNSGAGMKKADNTWEISYTIRDSQASGEYKIGEIEATVTLSQGGNVVFTYPAGEFSPITFKIDNPTTATKPAIKSITVGPKS